MKVYRGIVVGDYLKVIVQENREVRHLKQIVQHSPTGMSWGYLGSGPADLALSVLADYFEERPDRVKAALRHIWGPKSKASALYHQFKVAFVAQWPNGDDWSLDATDIAEWLSLAPQADLLDRLLAPARILERVEC